MDSIRRHFELLREDPWRANIGFSTELDEALRSAQTPSATDGEVATLFDSWIAKYQPCLFGRVAAKKNLLHYCILREENLLGPQEALRKKIQGSRLAWKRRALNGESSGFIIAALSSRLTLAIPDENVLAIAKRLASLYLLEEIEPDTIYVDRIQLELPGRNLSVWEWLVGANYFSAQGEKRWWQDHRFPAGIAFSMNSVGHMVKSGRLSSALKEFASALGTESELFGAAKIDSLGSALEFAMRTILAASQGPSGQATELLELSAADSSGRPSCPIDLPKMLKEKNYCEYLGRYHTDITLPSEYFRADVLRPNDVGTHQLDFTYLFDASLDNPDFDRMGQGLQIRERLVAAEPADVSAYRFEKRLRAGGVELNAEEASQLRQELNQSKDED